jgi:hypothetical protein
MIRISFFCYFDINNNCGHFGGELKISEYAKFCRCAAINMVGFFDQHEASKNHDANHRTHF